MSVTWTSFRVASWFNHFMSCYSLKPNICIWPHPIFNRLLRILIPRAPILRWNYESWVFKLATFRVKAGRKMLSLLYPNWPMAKTPDSNKFQYCKRRIRPALFLHLRQPDASIQNHNHSDNYSVGEITTSTKLFCFSLLMIITQLYAWFSFKLLHLSLSFNKADNKWQGI